MAGLSLEALAKAVGTTRRSLLEWRKFEDAPQGRDPVVWCAYMKERMLGQYSIRLNAPPTPAIKTQIDTGSHPNDERALRLRERHLAVEKAEHKLAEQKRDVLPIVEFQSALRGTITAFDAALKQLASRSADAIALHSRGAVLDTLRRILTPKQFEKFGQADTVIDCAVVVKILESEIEIVRATLASAEFLNPPPGT